MTEMRNKFKSAVFVSAVTLLPFSVAADVLELSQGQIRELVAQRQVLSAETMVLDMLSDFGGNVIDIRAFLSEGDMTYRLLLQRDDGSVIELLIDGVTGDRLSNNSQMGQTVSTAARSLNSSQNSDKGGNREDTGDRVRSGDRQRSDRGGRSDERDRSDDRGRSGSGRDDSRRN